MSKSSNGSKKKTQYRQGTINGVRTESTKRMNKKQRQQQENKRLIRMLVCGVVVLIMVFVLNYIITSNFTFNGIYYEEPEDSEVIEIVSSSNEEEEPAERVSLHLEGDLVIDLKVGDTYVEPGFTATSDLKGDISSSVTLTGSVDTSKAGSYKLTYTLNYRGISPKLTRLVRVSEKSSGTSSSSGSGSSSSSTPTPSASSSPTPSTSPTPSASASPSPSPSASPTPTATVSLTLNGSETVYVVEGSTYTDAGATAKDSNGNNLSSQIKVSGSVNTNVPGTYKLTYSITDYNNKTLTVSRSVIVQNMGITLTLDNSNYTSGSVNIIVTVNVDNFSSLVLPSGERTTSKTYTYKVTKNGTYEFVVYNSSGDSRKASMVVKNIDKEKPKGKCSITHNGDSSTITITATDNAAIAKYIYAGTEYTTNEIYINHRLSSGLQINVGFYDKAGNYGNANCIVP